MSWLSPEEFLLGELPETALLPVSGLIEASLARRWCRRVTDPSGEALRGIGWPRSLNVCRSCGLLVFDVLSAIVFGTMPVLDIQVGAMQHGVKGMPQQAWRKLWLSGC